METLEQISNRPGALIVEAQDSGDSATSFLEVSDDGCEGTNIRIGVPRIQWLHVYKLPVGCD
jgi:hypothetical protein